MKIAFCITCKGRAQHLKRTLPQNLSDNADYPNCVFVVVDYGSTDDLREWMGQYKDDERVAYYHYPDATTFKMSHAKNMAHRCGLLEGADILVSLDADNFTGQGFATYIAEQFRADPSGKTFMWALMIKGVLPRGINGRIVVSRQAFMNVGGYDEKFEAWSGEDKDFNLRLTRLGYKGISIDPRYLNAIPHNDKMRFREYRNNGQCDYYDQPEDWYISETTVVNWGRFGCGTVYRNFEIEAIELKPLPTRIFGIGMHKTATTSLHLAMKHLGFDSAHWRSAHWAKAIWTEMKAWGRSNTLENSYHLCDLPIPVLFREIDQAYPGSKFILTTLDEEMWVKAAECHWSPRNKFRSAWDSDPFSHKIHQIIYGQRHFDREVFLARYRRHNAEVLEYFRYRSDDLLLMPMNQGAGWKELCGFVGSPVPAMPYPHGNPDAAPANRHWIHAGDL